MENAPNERISQKKLIIAPIIGLVSTVAVLAYMNMQFISQKITYAQSPASNLTTESQVQPKPTTLLARSEDPAIVIPKISVDAPTVYDIPSEDETDVQLALQKGVLHYPGTPLPGEKGNIAMFGHSSGAAWRPGNYKFVFMLLEKLEPHDEVILEYKGIKYIYTVSDKKIVEPSEVSVIYPTDDYRLTLITCYPVGTNAQRMVVTAKLTSPEPIQRNELLHSTLKDFSIDPFTSKGNSRQLSPGLWNSLDQLSSNQ